MHLETERTKKIMCSNPQNNGEYTFACRKCNDCIAARKNDWVARAMAEKVTSSETIAIELTYRNNPDGTLPDSARAFRYQDVTAFLKNLREAYFYKYHARGEIRFIVAGERGSRRNRVHWHMVLFADKPISELGQWSDFLGNPLDEMRHKKMDHWSFWPHGHVYPKVPDQGGMEYVLKYALKDQFNSVRSKGTMRYSKSEDSAASYFRMSKSPPLGMRYLDRQCDRWESSLSVPPSLHLNVPEYRGFWYPKVGLREHLLDRLHMINERSKKERGRDAPQWNTLLASVLDSEKDWEGLYYGPQEIEITDDSGKRAARPLPRWFVDDWHKRAQVRRRRFAEIASERRDRDEAEFAASQADISKTCKGLRPCFDCWKNSPREDRVAFRKWYEAQFDKFVEYHRQTAHPIHETFDDWYRGQSGGGFNSLCRSVAAVYERAEKNSA